MPEISENPNSEAAAQLLESLSLAIADPSQISRFFEDAENFLPSILDDLGKANEVIDSISAIVENPSNWDDASSSLEYIGDRIAETGRDVWANHG